MVIDNDGDDFDDNEFLSSSKVYSISYFKQNKHTC